MENNYKEGQEYFFIGIPKDNDWEHCYVKKFRYQSSFEDYIGFKSEKKANGIIDSIKSLFKDPSKYEQVPANSNESFWRIIVSSTYAVKTIHIKSDIAKPKHQTNNYRNNCFKYKKEAIAVESEIRKILDI